MDVYVTMCVKILWLGFPLECLTLGRAQTTLWEKDSRNKILHLEKPVSWLSTHLETYIYFLVGAR